MFLASFPVGPLQANCYLVGAGPADGTGTTEVVVVDPGMDAVAPIAAAVAEHGLTPVGVLVTHGHFDHVWSAEPVATTYDVPVWVHAADRHLLADPMAAVSGESAAMLRTQLGMDDLPPLTAPKDVRDADPAEPIVLAGCTFTVDHVPGHTPGTVAYRVAYDGPQDVSQLMFSGDFLFAGSIGRTDLAGGDHARMLASLAATMDALADDVVVLPGHGPQTSIGRERAGNPFLAELR